MIENSVFRVPAPRQGERWERVKATLTSENDMKCMNWLAIGEQIAVHVRRKIADALDGAAAQLGELKPGERRSFTIEIGNIEISREMEGDTVQAQSSLGVVDVSE